MGKKGAMELSFGMIFSIILIIFFLAFAVYGITKFLGFQRSVQVGQFTNNLQTDIDKMWQGVEGSAEKEYVLPKNIDYVCFTDIASPAKGPKAAYYKDLELISAGVNNLFFYPIGSAEGLDTTTINHIDIKKITSTENPYCIPSLEGKVKVGIKMELGDSLVTITR